MVKGSPPAVASRRFWAGATDLIALLFALLHLYTATFGVLEGIQQRGIHLGFALVLILLSRPLSRGGTPGVADLLLTLLALVPSIYLVIEDAVLDLRIGIADDRDILLGPIFMLVLLEATRRVTGLALPLLAALSIAYALFGQVRGGPAKVAVVASGFFGMISGSAVANVASTGALTIPLMRRLGFSARFAGAVEAVASSCGQFMPPIMAAAAFVIAETLAIPYLQVAAGALIPAVLYYAALFVAVDLRAGGWGCAASGGQSCRHSARCCARARI
jgi:TRAP-type uncharacterized transport system fused permease subunit